MAASAAATSRIYLRSHSTTHVCAAVGAVAPPLGPGWAAWQGSCAPVRGPRAARAAAASAWASAVRFNAVRAPCVPAPLLQGGVRRGSGRRAADEGLRVVGGPRMRDRVGRGAVAAPPDAALAAHIRDALDGAGLVAGALHADDVARALLGGDDATAPVASAAALEQFARAQAGTADEEGRVLAVAAAVAAAAAQGRVARAAFRDLVVACCGARPLRFDLLGDLFEAMAAVGARSTGEALLERVIHTSARRFEEGREAGAMRGLTSVVQRMWASEHGDDEALGHVPDLDAKLLSEDLLAVADPSRWTKRGQPQGSILSGYVLVRVLDCLLDLGADDEAATVLRIFLRRPGPIGARRLNAMIRVFAKQQMFDVVLALLQGQRERGMHADKRAQRTTIDAMAKVSVPARPPAARVSHPWPRRQTCWSRWRPCSRRCWRTARC